MVCEQCQSPFEKRSWNHIYCSHRCKDIVGIASRTARYVPVVRPDAWMPCKYMACSKIFNAVEGHRHGGPLSKYCSVGCRNSDFYQHNPNRGKFKTYGITEEIYQDMLRRQRGTCAVCASPTNGGDMFCIDHDHDCCPGRRCCGKCVRGLLCHGCNQSAGLLRNNPTTVRKLAKYLSKWKQK